MPDTPAPSLGEIERLVKNAMSAATGYWNDKVSLDAVGEAEQALLSAIARLEAENAALREALAEIAKGEGRFSLDHLTHASNTIENMKALAVAALAAPKGGDRE